MILVIRISGMVKVPKKVQEALHRLRLRRKYSAVLMENNDLNRKLLKKIRDYVAYGMINEEMLEKLIKIRGKSIGGKKINAKDIISGLEKKKLESLGVKPFFQITSSKRRN